MKIIANTTSTMLKRIKPLLMKHQFATAIMLVILITVFMVGGSMTMYIMSGASGLDLSRPGFSKALNGLDRESNTVFESTGSLNQSDLNQFKKLYEKQRSKLQGLGAFNDSTLSDESLGLTVSSETPDTTE